MRWKKRVPSQKAKKKPLVHGDIREKVVFLWFPKCLDGEYRWLEKHVINQRYELLDYVGSCWYDLGWNDDSKLAKELEYKRECRRAAMNGWSY